MTAAKHAKKHCDCCWTAAASESGCTLPLPTTGKFGCLSGSAYQANHNHSDKLADYMIFWSTEDERLGAVELKGRNPDASEVQEQLQNAATVIEAIMDGECVDAPFAAAVLHSKISAVGIRAFGKKRVRFRGRDHMIQIKRCGTRFDSLTFA